MLYKELIDQHQQWSRAADNQRGCNNSILPPSAQSTEENVNWKIIIEIIPSQMEVAPLHYTVDITRKRRLFRNTKEIEKM